MDNLNDLGLDSLLDSMSEPSVPKFQLKTLEKVIKDTEGAVRPPQLLDYFLMKGEFSIFFGASGTGKSVWLDQVLRSIALNVPIGSLALQTQTPLKCLLVDYEMSDELYSQRCKGKDNNLNQNYLQMRPDSFPADMSPSDFLMQELENIIVENDIEVVGIDNFTAIWPNVESSEDAALVIEAFKVLMKKYGTTFIMVCHTPKMDPREPIEQRHLKGSSTLAQLTPGSVWAIGKSYSDVSNRYLKQIKSRNQREIYNGDKVVTLRLHNTNGLQFDVVSLNDSERDHLRAESAVFDDSEIKAALQRPERPSVSAVADELGVKRHRVASASKSLKSEGTLRSDDGINSLGGQGVNE